MSIFPHHPRSGFLIRRAFLLRVERYVRHGFRDNCSGYQIISTILMCQSRDNGILSACLSLRLPVMTLESTKFIDICAAIMHAAWAQSYNTLLL